MPSATSCAVVRNSVRSLAKLDQKRLDSEVLQGLGRNRVKVEVVSRRWR